MPWCVYSKKMVILSQWSLSAIERHYKLWLLLWFHLISHVSLWLLSLQVIFWSAFIFLSPHFWLKDIFSSSIQLRFLSHILPKWSKCILVTSLWKYSIIDKNLDTSQQNSGVVPMPTVWSTKVIVLLLCILCAFKFFMKLKCYWTAIIGNINLLYSF